MCRRCLPFNVLTFAVALSLSPSWALAQTGALTSIEDNDPIIHYTGTWYTNTGSLNSGGEAALTNAKDAEATIIFSGTGIAWVGYSDQWSGIAWVYLDGVLTTVDTYSANPQYQRILFSVHGLPAGSHNLTIEVPHARGPDALGAWVWIDRFDIDNGAGVSGGASLTTGLSEQTNAAITYAGVWYTDSGNAFSGGTVAGATDVASLATVTFTGTGITWIGYADPWSGIANVSVDGVPNAMVDTYRAAAQSQASLFSVSGLSAGTHTLTIEVTGTHNPSSSGSWIWLDAFSVVSDSGSGGQPPPAINSLGLVNAANLGNASTAGSIVSLFGSGLASGIMKATGVPLPPALGTTSVQVNGIPAPLFYVSPTQINFQVPWEVSGQQHVSVTVTAGNQMSAPVSLNLAPLAPGIFATNGAGTGQGAVLIAGSSSLAAPVGFATGSRPAARGEYLSIYATGLGPVTSPPSSGAPSPGNSPPTTTTTPTVLIGGASAPIVQFSGLAPGFVGLYQINVQVPPLATVGSQVPLVLLMGGVSSNTVTVAIQ
jgi:uncharacterized protein (TIGR03437 family)